MTRERLKAHHAEHARKAANLYLKSRSASTEAEAWHLALREARRHVATTLRASKMLANVELALAQNGSYMAVLRRFMAPPISQDQFKLLCRSWPKSTEKTGKIMSRAAAMECAAVFSTWRHRYLTAWLDRKTVPSRSQLRTALSHVALLMTSQEYATLLRNALARKQESDVIALLGSKGWKKLPSRLVDTRALLAPKQYMHKTRFATASGSQEVDVACGLKGTYVLAMECKVTNDETNSVKRVNDVLKKAEAWKKHWGSFVETAALLQGVIAAKDVARLIDADVHVFWSHDLPTFGTWIDSRV